MQEISSARQESGAQSNKQSRCRVCDGPVDWPNLVCRQCWQREREFEKWESYSEGPDGNDTTTGNLIPAKDYVLIMLCEPSHAGKSTLAVALKPQGNFQVISSNEIRKQLTGSYRNFEHENLVSGAFQRAKHQAVRVVMSFLMPATYQRKQGGICQRGLTVLT